MRKMCVTLVLFIKVLKIRKKDIPLKKAVLRIGFCSKNIVNLFKQIGHVLAVRLTKWIMICFMF